MKRTKELNRVINRLKKVPCINEIALFGSRARRLYTKESDYDLMLFCDEACEIPDEEIDRVFSLPKKFDIKMIDDRKHYGDLMLVLDRQSWKTGEEGTYISSDILEDMKSLWKKKGA